MRKHHLPILIVAVILICILAYTLVHAPTFDGVSSLSETVYSPASTTQLINVSSPAEGAEISSPLHVAGMAVGNWYFEASFPVSLTDASGNVLAQAPAKAQGDWMTTDKVPFSVDLIFTAQEAGSHGYVILKNDNPSGDPANEKSVKIPVTFK